jgi:biopolymer transport protein ExbD
MQFSMRGRSQADEPDINLIPMIDLFLVIIIFLMQTTTYDRFSELQITLPRGGEVVESAPKDKPKEIFVGVQSTGLYKFDEEKIPAGATVDRLRLAFQNVIQKRKAPSVQELIVVINADARATHQSVVNVMEAANQVGIGNITFATQPLSVSDQPK